MIDATLEITEIVEEQPATEAGGQESQIRNICAACGSPIPATKKGAPNRRKFCNDACKQAFHRERKGADISIRRSGQAHHHPRPEGTRKFSPDAMLDETPICARPGCDIPVKRGKTIKFLMYCSDSCKDKMKRKRRKEGRLMNDDVITKEDLPNRERLTELEGILRQAQADQAAGKLPPERPTPPAIAAGHNHAEAFNLMTYTCDQCNGQHRAWNSRDGVTPFILIARCPICQGDLTHRVWGLDQYAPDHVPEVGQLIFIDIPPELKPAAARFKHAQFVAAGFSDDMPDNILELLAEEFEEGAPWIIRWGA